MFFFWLEIIIVIISLYGIQANELLIIEECNPPIKCLNETVFTLCFVKNGVHVIQDTSYVCPDGYMCSENSTDKEPCQTDETRSPSVATPLDFTPLSTCEISRKYPAAQCDQYYECVGILWWFELIIRSCPARQVFDYETRNCVSNENKSC